MEENYTGFLKELSCFEYHVYLEIILLENTIAVSRVSSGVSWWSISFAFRSSILTKSVNALIEKVPATVVCATHQFRRTALNDGILKSIKFLIGDIDTVLV